MPSSLGRRRAALVGRHAGVGEERHQPVAQPQLAVGDVDQRAVAAVAVEEHQPPRRGHRHAAPDVVEHGEQRRRRQPDRARRPGVLVRLGVGQRRQQPHVELVADPLDGGRRPPRSAISRSVFSGRCGPCCSIAPSGCTRMLRSREAAGDVGRRGGGRAAIGRHACTLPADQRWQRDGTPTITTRSSSAPGTTGWSPRPTSPGPACARSCSRPGRSSAARRPASRSPAATVNICNCDHVTFRTTPVIDDLDLAAFGLRYIDIEPAARLPRRGRAGRRGSTGTTSSARSTSSPRTHPGEVDGYRRYVRGGAPGRRADPRRGRPSRRPPPG